MVEAINGLLMLPLVELPWRRRRLFFARREGKRRGGGRLAQEEREGGAHNLHGQTMVRVWNKGGGARLQEHVDAAQAAKRVDGDVQRGAPQAVEAIGIGLGVEEGLNDDGGRTIVEQGAAVVVLFGVVDAADGRVVALSLTVGGPVAQLGGGGKEPRLEGQVERRAALLLLLLLVVVLGLLVLVLVPIEKGGSKVAVRGKGGGGGAGAALALALLLLL